MQKTNASKQARKRAYMHNRIKGCAFLRMRTNKTVSPFHACACAVI